MKNRFSKRPIRNILLAIGLSSICWLGNGTMVSASNCYVGCGQGAFSFGVLKEGQVFGFQSDQLMRQYCYSKTSSKMRVTNHSWEYILTIAPVREFSIEFLLEIEYTESLPDGRLVAKSKEVRQDYGEFYAYTVTDVWEDHLGNGIATYIDRPLVFNNQFNSVLSIEQVPGFEGISAENLLKVTIKERRVFMTFHPTDNGEGDFVQAPPVECFDDNPEEVYTSRLYDDIMAEAINAIDNPDVFIPDAEDHDQDPGQDPGHDNNGPGQADNGNDPDQQHGNGNNPDQQAGNNDDPDQHVGNDDRPDDQANDDRPILDEDDLLQPGDEIPQSDGQKPTRPNVRPFNTPVGSPNGHVLKERNLVGFRNPSGARELVRNNNARRSQNGRVNSRAGERQLVRKVGKVSTRFGDKPSVQYLAASGELVLSGLSVSQSYIVAVADLSGKALFRKTISGLTDQAVLQPSVQFNGGQLYIVRLTSFEGQVSTAKIFIQ